MGRAAVAEEVEVGADGVDARRVARRLGDEALVAVLPLGAGRHLQAVPQQVEAAGQVRTVLETHVVEGPHPRGVLGDEDQLVAEFGSNVLAHQPLPVGVEVTLWA